MRMEKTLAVNVDKYRVAICCMLLSHVPLSRLFDDSCGELEAKSCYINSIDCVLCHDKLRKSAKRKRARQKHTVGKVSLEIPQAVHQLHQLEGRGIYMRLYLP